AFAGSILASPSRFKPVQILVVTAGLLFTLFAGFSSGTRNVFCIYLLIFLASYIISKRNINWKQLVAMSSIVVILLYIGAYYMLQFRQTGLGNYLEGTYGNTFSYKEKTLFIDLNLPVISRLTDVFPKHHDYLGSEFIIYAVFLPVPRILWSSKPE